jgi:uncharacterized protein (TIGR00369 family)
VPAPLQLFNSPPGGYNAPMPLMMNAAEISAFLASEFPESDPARTTIEEIRDGYARMRRRIDASDLRPGGTVSGPTMMALADNAMYVALLAMIGPVALAVTTNLTINFLRKPEPADLVAEARLLKLGRRLAVGEVRLFSPGVDDPVAHCTATYSIPPR